MSELAAVCRALHQVMAPYAAALVVKRDDGQELYLDRRPIQKNKLPLCFGAVQVKQAFGHQEQGYV